MSRRSLGILGVAGISFAASLVLAGPASAHVPKISTECTKGVSVDLESYNSNAANTVNVLVDGKSVNSGPLSFGTSYTHDFAVPQDNNAHSWEVDVKAGDDPEGKHGWTTDPTGSVGPCQQTPPVQPQRTASAKCTGSNLTVKFDGTRFESGATNSFVYLGNSQMYATFSHQAADAQGNLNIVFPVVTPPAGVTTGKVVIKPVQQSFDEVDRDFTFLCNSPIPPVKTKLKFTLTPNNGSCVTKGYGSVLVGGDTDKFNLSETVNGRAVKATNPLVLAPNTKFTITGTVKNGTKNTMPNGKASELLIAATYKFDLSSCKSAPVTPVIPVNPNPPVSPHNNTPVGPNAHTNFDGTYVSSPKNHHGSNAVVVLSALGLFGVLLLAGYRRRAGAQQ